MRERLRPGGPGSGLEGVPRGGGGCLTGGMSRRPSPQWSAVDSAWKGYQSAALVRRWMHWAPLRPGLREVHASRWRRLVSGGVKSSSIRRNNWDDPTIAEQDFEMLLEGLKGV